MTLNEFIRSLSGDERKTIARQAECSVNYLNNLASSDSLASLNLTARIFRCSFNKKLPAGERFGEPEYLAYRKQIRAERTKG